MTVLTHSLNYGRILEIRYASVTCWDINQSRSKCFFIFLCFESLDYTTRKLFCFSPQCHYYELFVMEQRKGNISCCLLLCCLSLYVVVSFDAIVSFDGSADDVVSYNAVVSFNAVISFDVVVLFNVVVNFDDVFLLMSCSGFLTSKYVYKFKSL